LSGLKKLFVGYLILSKSFFWPVTVLPRLQNQPEASVQAQLKLGQIVLQRMLYQTHLRVLTSDICFLFFGAPKMNLQTIFQSSVIRWRMPLINKKRAQFVCYIRLLNPVFGSSQMEDWLPKCGHFEFWSVGGLQN
jgi:hypothetical protein